MLNDIDCKQENDELKTEENCLFSLEKEAEKIIDDIFSELDDILDVSYDDITCQENIESDDHVFEEDNIPLPLEAELLSEITPRKEEIIKQKYFDSTAFAEQEVLLENQGLIKHLDKLLFVGSLTFLIGIIFWLINTEKLKFPVLVNQTQEIATLENINPSQDQEFANYLLQSLKIIDQEKSLIAAKPTIINNPKPDEKILSDNNSVPVNSPTRIIERIYIPFVQSSPPPTPIAKTTPTPQPTPQVISPTTPIVETIPTSQAKPVTTPPPPPVIQETETPPPSPIVENNEETVTEVANTVPDSYTVVGLIELGDRSAALFEVNGVTRRINVGENIGQSGWNLESVGNDQVTVNRNGQVRSLSVGQQF
jgi:hypothetical protein